MLPTTALTFDQYNTELTNLTAKKAKLRTAMCNRDDSVDEVATFIAPYTIAGLEYAAKGEVMYTLFCMHVVILIKEFIDNAILEARQDRGAFDSLTDQIVQLNNRRLFELAS